MSRHNGLIFILILRKVSLKIAQLITETNEGELAGYSKLSLVDKLGIKSGFRILFQNPPDDYSKILGPLPEGVHLAADLTEPVDFIQFFSKSRDEVEAAFPVLSHGLRKNGMLWMSWPKKASKVATDLDENVIREIGLSHGLVDIKVCAVDETWSGLKFVFRLENRS